MLFLGSCNTPFRQAAPQVVLTGPEDRLRVTLVGTANMLIGFSSVYLLEDK